MAEPARKKIKLSLKKELKKDRKDERHKYANAIEYRLAEASALKPEPKPIHVTKSLMNRELTGKMPPKAQVNRAISGTHEPRKKKLLKKFQKHEDKAEDIVSNRMKDRATYTKWMHKHKTKRLKLAKHIHKAHHWPADEWDIWAAADPPKKLEKFVDKARKKHPYPKTK